MSESNKNNDMISKCAAIQYACLVAGLVLLVIVSYNWYSDYSSACATNCSVAKKSCKAQCLVEENKPKIPAPGFVEAEAAPANLPATSGFASKKLSEAKLESFLGSPDGASYDHTIHYDPAAESLEPGVFESHQEFVEDAYVSTQGPARDVERDDTNEVVTRWGLRRVDYTGVFSQDDARVVSSEYPEQVAQNANSFVL